MTDKQDSKKLQVTKYNDLKATHEVLPPGTLLVFDDTFDNQSHLLFRDLMYKGRHLSHLPIHLEDIPVEETDS